MIGVYVVGYLIAVGLLCLGISMLIRARPRAIILNPRYRGVASSVRWTGAGGSIGAACAITVLTFGAVGGYSGTLVLLVLLAFVGMGVCSLMAAWTARRGTGAQIGAAP